MILALANAALLSVAVPSTSLVLTWHAPTHDAPAPRQCGVGPASSDVAECVLYRQRQSATWVAMRPAMLALPEVWAAYWPQVRAEAAPQEVARLSAVAGLAMSYTVTDSAGWSYSVVSRDARGNASCVSNYYGR